MSARAGLAPGPGLALDLAAERRQRRPRRRPMPQRTGRAAATIVPPLPQRAAPAPMATSRAATRPQHQPRPGLPMARARRWPPGRTLDQPAGLATAILAVAAARRRRVLRSRRQLDQQHAGSWARQCAGAQRLAAACCATGRAELGSQWLAHSAASAGAFAALRAAGYRYCPGLGRVAGWPGGSGPGAESRRAAPALPARQPVQRPTAQRAKLRVHICCPSFLLSPSRRASFTNRSELELTHVGCGIGQQRA